MSLQQLKSVIQAAVPSIMELKFGCEARQGENVYTVLGKNKDLNGSFMVRSNESLAVFDSAILGANWHILGRPIRLADVLLAMQNKDMGCIGRSMNGDFLNCDDDMNNLTEVGSRWDLANDSLDNQSPETIEFLSKLLCK